MAEDGREKNSKVRSGRTKGGSEANLHHPLCHSNVKGNNFNQESGAINIQSKTFPSNSVTQIIQAECILPPSNKI